MADTNNLVDGRYKLLEVVGKGSFSKVYKSLDIETGNLRALKFIDLEQISQTSTIDINEICRDFNCAPLSHNHLVKVYDRINVSTGIYVVMEFMENFSLLNMMKVYGGKIPENRIRSYTTQILKGLKYLHRKDIIHQNLKASNILLTKDGVVRLSDYETSKNLPQNNTAPFWMSPELIQMKKIGMSTDIWSLGCTILELLTGHPPYSNLGPVPALFKMVSDPHPPFPDLEMSDELMSFLKFCFTREPSMRPTADMLIAHPWISKESERKRDKSEGKERREERERDRDRDRDKKDKEREREKDRDREREIEKEEKIEKTDKLEKTKLEEKSSKKERRGSAGIAVKKLESPKVPPLAESRHPSMTFIALSSSITSALKGIDVEMGPQNNSLSKRGRGSSGGSSNTSSHNSLHDKSCGSLFDKSSGNFFDKSSPSLFRKGSESAEFPEYTSNRKQVSSLPLTKSSSNSSISIDSYGSSLVRSNSSGFESPTENSEPEKSSKQKSNKKLLINSTPVFPSTPIVSPAHSSHSANDIHKSFESDDSEHDIPKNTKPRSSRFIELPHFSLLPKHIALESFARKPVNYDSWGRSRDGRRNAEKSDEHIDEKKLSRDKHNEEDLKKKDKVKTKTNVMEEENAVESDGRVKSCEIKNGEGDLDKKEIKSIEKPRAVEVPKDKETKKKRRGSTNSENIQKPHHIHLPISLIPNLKHSIFSGSAKRKSHEQQQIFKEESSVDTYSSSQNNSETEFSGFEDDLVESFEDTCDLSSSPTSDLSPIQQAPKTRSALDKIIKEKNVGILKRIPPHETDLTLVTQELMDNLILTGDLYGAVNYSPNGSSASLSEYYKP